MNLAIKLLASFGGLGSLVAGVNQHYYADHQTQKKKSNRARLGRGNYGKTLMAHFAKKRLDKMK